LPPERDRTGVVGQDWRELETWILALISSQYHEGVLPMFWFPPFFSFNFFIEGYALETL
jgi:hypothetical protein